MLEIVKNLLYVAIFVSIAGILCKMFFFSESSKNDSRPIKEEKDNQQNKHTSQQVTTGDWNPTIVTQWTRQAQTGESGVDLVVTVHGKSNAYRKKVVFQDNRPFTIGRAPDNDLQILDPTVSRHHLIIFKDDEGWYCEAAEDNVETRDTNMNLVDNDTDIALAGTDNTKPITEGLYLGETKITFSLHEHYNKDTGSAHRQRRQNKEGRTVNFHVG